MSPEPYDHLTVWLEVNALSSLNLKPSTCKIGRKWYLPYREAVTINDVRHMVYLNQVTKIKEVVHVISQTSHYTSDYKRHRDRIQPTNIVCYLGLSSMWIGSWNVYSPPGLWTPGMVISKTHCG